MKDFFGCGRTRDAKGNVEGWHLNPYVNCIHTLVGHSRLNMEVLIAELDMSEIKYIGQMSSSQNSRVIDPEGISYAVTNGEKDGEPKIIEPIGCAMRGRNPENPSERGRSNGKYKQRIEMGSNISNTITSVQKDSLVAEPVAQEPYNADEGGCAKTILAGCYKFGAATLLRDSGSTMTSVIEYSTKTIEPNYRIRKLTPRECFRLMGVSESDIDKIQQSGVSQSQQYRMAGNSIVVDVLEHIFRKMFVDKGQESQQLSLF